MDEDKINSLRNTIAATRTRLDVTWTEQSDFNRNIAQFAVMVADATVEAQIALRDHKINDVEYANEKYTLVYLF